MERTGDTLCFERPLGDVSLELGSIERICGNLGLRLLALRPSWNHMAAVTGDLYFLLSVFVACTAVTVDGSKKTRKN